jgi:hypothetical protein
MANNLRFFRGIHLSAGNAIIAAIRLPRGGAKQVKSSRAGGVIVGAGGQARGHASVRKIRSAAPLDGSGLDSNSRGLLTAYQVALEFEFILLRHRVPISGDISSESRKSPPQRPHLQMFGRGESYFTAGDGQFAARISVGKFRATVWAGGAMELRRTKRREGLASVD